jgi:hypothetical protein
MPNYRSKGAEHLPALARRGAKIRRKKIIDKILIGQYAKDRSTQRIMELILPLAA